MSSPQAPRRTKEQWQVIVDEFQQSGLSAPQFCKEHAVQYASFVKWRRRLNPVQRKNSKLIAVSKQKVTADTRQHALIVCQLPSGHRLQWDTTVSPHYIAQLIGALP